MTSIQDSKKAIAPITATSRLNSDYKNLMKDPIPYIVAEPLASNILECHYVITGIYFIESAMFSLPWDFKGQTKLK